jgi:hypothetical protein
MTGPYRLTSLVTHATGATFVQTVVQGLSVGATLKLVRGIAAATSQESSDPASLRDAADSLVGKATNSFDTDVGVMATAGGFKAGLAIRNLREPEFEAAGDGSTLKLERQARAGVSLQTAAGFLMAADLDLTEAAGPHGPRRDLSVGGEGRFARRLLVRTGVRLNLAGDRITGRAPSVGIGGSYAIRASLLVDAQATVGAEQAARGWGIAARFVY